MSRPTLRRFHAAISVVRSMRPGPVSRWLAHLASRETSFLVVVPTNACGRGHDVIGARLEFEALRQAAIRLLAEEGGED